MTTDDAITSTLSSDAQTAYDLGDLTVQLFEHMQGQINFADTKAQLTLAADALLAAAITPLSQEVMAGLLGSSVSPLSRITGLLGVGMFVALLVSVYFSLVVARPVLHVFGASSSLFYFGNIIQHSEADFIKAFLSLTDDEIRAALLVQVYARSKIVWRKFRAIRHSLSFLVIALVLWIATQILPAFAG
ncbi:MAG: hypothetical protein JXB30_18165 [Anaerolineae bacterium]|nr:hypothetical protein [Anaerolineae bacterium]